MDEDIFPESKEEQEDKDDSNMEWKKNGIDKHERLTLKVNVKEANLYNANKKRETKPRIKARTPLEVPKGFKKISKKIRDSYDDEEDDDEYILVPVFMDKEISSLEKALTPQEKKQLEQMESAEDIHLRQTVEKDIQLQKAEEIIKKAGLEADRKITNQMRDKVTNVDAKDLAKENLKKEKSNDILNLKKQDKDSKSEKTLPKLKNAEEKEVKKVIMDDAEKDKNSVKKNLEREQQKKNEINPVTKEKTSEEKNKQPEAKQEEKTDSKKEEQLKAQNASEEKKKTFDEKTARQIILEKSGRKDTSNEALIQELELEQKLEREREQDKREEYQNTRPLPERYRGRSR